MYLHGAVDNTCAIFLLFILSFLHPLFWYALLIVEVLRKLYNTYIKPYNKYYFYIRNTHAISHPLSPHLASSTLHQLHHGYLLSYPKYISPAPGLISIHITNIHSISTIRHHSCIIPPTFITQEWRIIQTFTFYYRFVVILFVTIAATTCTIIFSSVLDYSSSYVDVDPCPFFLYT